MYSRHGSPAHKLTILIALLICFQITEVNGQFKEVDIEVSTGALASSSDLPFWHYANTRGRIFPGAQYAQFTTASALYPFQSPEASLDFSAGAHLTSRVADTRNTFHFEQFFAGLRYRIVKLRVGRFHDVMGEGMKLSDLSFGSMMQSNNARPVPKIQLSTDGYTNIPLTRGIAQFKAVYSDGILEQDREVASPYLHQKSLHMRLNIENGSVMFGVIHNVVWGGEHPNRGRLPQTFDDYLRVVLSRPADPDSDATDSEVLNKLGNSVAAYDFAGYYDFHNTRFILYRQIYLEDSVSAREWRSYWDGTYGIGLQRLDGSGLINSFIYEFIYTIRQDARSILLPQGRANYYGHFVYRNGWTYHDSVLGNPLLTYNYQSGRITNNMITGHHIGIQGTPIQELDYRFYMTYTRNYGICQDQIITGGCGFYGAPESALEMPPGLNFIPYTELLQHQFSFLVDMSYLIQPVLGLHINGSVAIDIGEFYPNRIGFMLGFSVKDRHRFR